MRPQVGTGYGEESEFVGLDGAAGQREAPFRPADLRVKPIKNAAQAMPRQRAGAFIDVKFEQGADTNPERRYEGGPGVLQPGGELIARPFRIGEQTGEQVAARFGGHTLAAPFELACNLRRALARISASWSRRRGLGSAAGDQEIGRVGAPRHGQQRRQVEPGRTSLDELQPGLVVGTRPLARERLRRRLRLPQGETGEVHGQQIVASPQRKQRHRNSRYAQARINCPRRSGRAYWMPCQVQASRHDG